MALGGARSLGERYLCAGFDTGDLKVVDLRMMRVCFERHFANGIVSAEFDRADAGLNKLLLGTLEGHVYALDVKNGFSPVSGGEGAVPPENAQSRSAQNGNDSDSQISAEAAIGVADARPFGDHSTIWQVRHCPFNRDVALVSGADKLALLRYEYPREREINGRTVPGTLRTVADAVVSTQTTQSVSWSHDKAGLVAWASMDQTVNVGYVTNLGSLE